MCTPAQVYSQEEQEAEGGGGLPAGRSSRGLVSVPVALEMLSPLTDMHPHSHPVRRGLLAGFTKQETKAQGGLATFPRAPGFEPAERSFEARTL